MADFLETQRKQLLVSLQKMGIRDKRVLTTMTDIPRERFVNEEYYDAAYANRALPIDMGQTISQPFMVAVMTQALRLKGTERVLEIGTGSGYQTAILSCLSAYVVSIERYQLLSFQAARHLTQSNIHNVSLYIDDGTLGWPDAAPYDRILVTAAAPEVPSQLLAQLTPQGLLVIPVGGHLRQELQVIQRFPSGMRMTSLGSCVFVPLIGAEGWHE